MGYHLTLEQRQAARWGMTSRQRLAMQAAMQGDWVPADALEMEWFGQQLVSHSGDCPKEDCAWCDLWSLIARRNGGVDACIARSYGPDCEDCIILTWSHGDAQHSCLCRLDGRILDYFVVR